MSQIQWNKLTALELKKIMIDEKVTDELLLKKCVRSE